MNGELIKFTIYSDGQIGVSQLVLETVLKMEKRKGIAPLRFITTDGRNIPDKYRNFLKEDETFKNKPLSSENDNYSSVIQMNVLNSDGTLILVPENFQIEKDEKICQTIKIAKKVEKLHLIIFLPENDKKNPHKFREIAKWIEEKEIFKLNVTGPRETNCPGIFDKNSLFMSEFLEKWSCCEFISHTLKKWEKLHPDFSKKISEKIPSDPKNDKTFLQKWREKGINYKEAISWIDMGFKPFEEKFSEIQYTCLPSHWKDNGFGPREVRYWLEKLKKNDYNFALYLKNKHTINSGEKTNPHRNIEIIRNIFGSVNLFSEKEKITIQDWLDTLYSPKRKKEAQNLVIFVNGKSLKGKLIINGWEKLRYIACYKNEFFSLKLINCPNLVSVFANNNQLTNLVIENCPQIQELSLSRNKLTDLSVFENLTNLRFLDIIGNQFTGSLKSFFALSKIQNLMVFDNPGINQDLEYLPASLKELGVGDIGGQILNFQEWRKKKP